MIDLAVFRPCLQECVGVMPAKRYGNKAVVVVAGEALWAELALLRMLEQDGWAGVWIDTYRRRYLAGMPEVSSPVELPERPERLLSLITRNAGRRWAGCWDVFVWRDDSFAFIESKLRGKDSLNANQPMWLQAALAAGVPSGRIAIAEWELRRDDHE